MGPGAKKVFLLSPASTSGRRAQLLFNERAAFELASALRRQPGVALGEAFSFLSGLYFRGKLAYANAFASCGSVFVITPDRGLVAPDLRVTLDDLRAFSASPIDACNPRYREPLMRAAQQIGDETDVILLGSIASGKYVDILLSVFGERLLFPLEFVGRGDMSRGGLMLRCVDSGEELRYVPVAGAARRGRRPPKLDPR